MSITIHHQQPTRPTRAVGQRRRRWLGVSAAAVLACAGLSAAVAPSGGAASADPASAEPATVVLADGATTTPIKHVVVLFDENISFDHYFATYPYATNADGTPFHAAADTPTTIDTALNAGLIPGDQIPAHNPNSDLDPSSVLYATPNPNAYQPQRLAPSQAVTCDQNHSYGPEQAAVNAGRMNSFVQSTNATCTTTGTYSSPGLVMDYYDGNTVTAMWNYAQHYAMSDNNWDTVFGPSTPGALNLISGNTYSGTATVNADVDPNRDAFGNLPSATTPTMYGANVGDLLNAKGVSWGWFQGGFASSTATTANIAGAASKDYSPHHDPFQYYASTQNWAHTPPTDGAEVGLAGPANHQYDLSVFNDALSGTPINGVAATLPAVSFLKAPEAQDGHAGYSDPLDEQEFLASEIDAIQSSPEWSSTAIVVTEDDSDGWYDHVAPTITNASTGSAGDAAICTTAASYGVPQLGGYPGRCGPSQRLPLLVISPYAKRNYVSHTMTDQASVLRFIEDNWSTGTIDSLSGVKGSFDATANSLDDMFDWTHPQSTQVQLDATMYRSGVSSCAGVSDVSTCIAPTFGAVSGTPADVTAPVPAPVVGVAKHTLSLPAGSAVPDESDFMAQVGATISHGTLTADLSGVDTSTVGTYPVTVRGADGDVPSMDPQVIDVQVAPALSALHTSLTFATGSHPSPSYVRSLTGATIVGGVMDLPDLSAVDFDVPGTYTIELTGAGNGIAAAPVSVTITVVSTTAPVISVATSSVVYPVGAAPTADAVAAAAGASISSGTLDPLSLAGVDFDVPGTYPVSLTGGDGSQEAAPVTLSVTVVATPVITLGRPDLTLPAGVAPSSAQVLADALASISSGTLDAVDLSAVAFATPGTYGVSVGGQDRGIRAVPANLTIHVVAAPVRPVASATRLTLGSGRVGYPKAVAITVRVTASSTPTGKVAVYDGSRLARTLTLAKGSAHTSLKLGVGRHSLHAAYLGTSSVAGSTSGRLGVTVTKAASRATVRAVRATVPKRTPVRLRIQVSASGLTPAGTVAVYDGTRVVAHVRLVKGHATVALRGLRSGTHRLHVRYAGSGTAAASTSATVTVRVGGR